MRPRRFRQVAGFSAFGWWWGGGGGVIASINMAILPKTSVFPAFSAKGCVTFLEQDTRSEAFVPMATMPNTLVFTAFLLLYTTYYGRRHAVTSTNAFGEDATTLVFAACLPVCTLFCLFVQNMRKNAVRSVFVRKQRSKSKHFLGCQAGVSKTSLCAVFSCSRAPNPWCQW